MAKNNLKGRSYSKLWGPQMMSLTCGLNFLGSCQSLGFASVELPDDQKKGGIHQKTLEKIKMYVKFVHAWSSVIFTSCLSRQSNLD